MSIRKRSWQTRKGEQRSAWICDYVDRAGKRHIETFPTQKQAKSRWAEIETNKKAGRHVPRSSSITIAQAGDNWIEVAEKIDKLQAATVIQYRQHLNLHISPYLGHVKLSDLTAPDIAYWQKELATADVSEAMQIKVRTSLGSLLAQAVQDGNLTHNVVRDAGRRKRRRVKKKRLEAGVDFPTLDEVRHLMEKTQGRFRPFFILAVCTGMRASELRGLRWQDVDFKKQVVHVRQRADRYKKIDAPKSEAGHRSIPLIMHAVNTLKEWKLACPPSDLDLVFPTKYGGVQNYDNIRLQQLIPLMERAGIVDEAGKAKYTGLHSIRHFYASWLINRPEDGGQGLPAKVVQERLGHASITMTMDVYGHLFPRGDDREELVQAEHSLLGTF